MTYNSNLNTYTQANVIRYILDEGWAFAGQAITLDGFAASAYKARETGEAFRTLNKAMLLELVYPTTISPYEYGRAITVLIKLKQFQVRNSD